MQYGFNSFRVVKLEDTQSVFISADVMDHDEILGCIGMYVARDGKILTDDCQVWNIDQDLDRLGIIPGSAKAEELIEQWTACAREIAAHAFE